MEAKLLYSVIPLVINFLLLYILLTKFLPSLLKLKNIWKYPEHPPLPPGPSPLPILGNLLHLGKKPHQSLAEIAKRHGPLVCLQLGCRTTIVISSPSVAQEMFQKHDSVLANRSYTHSVTASGHHLKSVAFLPPGQQWRHLKRIWNTHLVAPARIDAGQELRRKKMEQLVSYLKERSEANSAVNIGEVVFTTSVNILSNTAFSMDIASITGPKAAGNNLKEIIKDLLEEAGKPNISDFFPVLKPFDLQGCYSRAKALIEKMLKTLDEIIDQRLQLWSLEARFHAEDKDVLDSLIRINQKEKSGSDSSTQPVDIPHFLVDYFVAGTDTTSTTMEWAIAELLRHPEKMRKAQVELDEVIGRGNPLDESDFAKLPYLQAIIKETMRLHPPAPLLVPRKADMDVELLGFTIPKDAQVLVNLWAIGRDESVWENASLFEPERFLRSSIDLKGGDYNLIPFGAGRRICIGTPLALRIFPLVLGSLIHRFDWKMLGGLSASEIDMDDKFGLALQRAKPLLVIPNYRG